MLYVQRLLTELFSLISSITHGKLEIPVVSSIFVENKIRCIFGVTQLTYNLVFKDGLHESLLVFVGQ